MGQTSAGAAGASRAATAGLGNLGVGEPGQIQLGDSRTPPDASTGHVTVCEPSTAGGGSMCWDWFLDPNLDSSYWSPTDRSGGHL